jgi:ubiquinone/menaquinone biosynthesis C-methylase UbiE
VPVGVFLTGHAEALALASSSVDVVTTTFSFHHWSDQAAGLREIARVLRAGGTLLLLDPSPLPRISRVLGAHRFTSKRELAALFEQAGLRVETSRSWLACCRITRASKE